MSRYDLTTGENIVSNAARINASIAAVLLSATPASQAGDIADPYGSPAPAPSARREIRIDPATRYVNVARGEIIRFSTPQGTFAWSFDTDRNRNGFEFSRIAPKTVATEGIRVFVADLADDR